MSVVIINVSNHTLTDAQTYGGKAQVVELPSTLKKDYSNIVPSEVNEISNRLMEFIMYTSNDYRHNNKVIVHLAGHPSTSAQVSQRLSEKWFTTQLVYGHSIRDSVEELNEDGTIVKRNVFNFNGWYDMHTNKLVELKDLV